MGGSTPLRLLIFYGWVVVAVAFSGVGVGSIILLLWLQARIGHAGWRATCWTLRVLVLALLAPLNPLLQRRPEDLGLVPDGDGTMLTTTASNSTAHLMDAVWVAVDWTLGRAIRTSRFWWIAVGYFCGMFAWYAVQIHDQGQRDGTLCRLGSRDLRPDQRLACGHRHPMHWARTVPPAGPPDTPCDPPRPRPPHALSWAISGVSAPPRSAVHTTVHGYGSHGSTGCRHPC